MGNDERICSTVRFRFGSCKQPIYGRFVFTEVVCKRDGKRRRLLSANDLRSRHDYAMGDPAKPRHAAEHSHMQITCQDTYKFAIPDIMAGDLWPAHCCEDGLVGMRDASRLPQYLHPIDCSTRNRNWQQAQPGPRAYSVRGTSASPNPTRRKRTIHNGRHLRFLQAVAIINAQGAIVDITSLLSFQKTRQLGRTLFTAMHYTAPHPADPLPRQPQRTSAPQTSRYGCR